MGKRSSKKMSDKVRGLRCWLKPAGPEDMETQMRAINFYNAEKRRQGSIFSQFKHRILSLRQHMPSHKDRF